MQFFIINIIISLSILNVWLVRLNKKTNWRGGSSITLKEEFNNYGLPIWSFYIIGFLKINLAILLLLGIWFDQLNLLSSIMMSILMIGSIIMHLKIKDPIKKSLPAVCILFLLITLIIQHSNTI